MQLYNEANEPQEAPVQMDYEQYQGLKQHLLELISLGEMSIKLASVPEFNTLIMGDYFTNEPKRLGMLMASGKITGKAFDGCVEDLRAIGHLRAFVTGYITRMESARNQLASLEEAYAQAVAENGIAPEATH